MVALPRLGTKLPHHKLDGGSDAVSDLYSRGCRIGLIEDFDSVGQLIADLHDFFVDVLFQS